jgi:hypothetical protein
MDRPAYLHMGLQGFKEPMGQGRADILLAEFVKDVQTLRVFGLRVTAHLFAW